MHSNSGTDDLRERLAETAARLMVERGIRDFGMAKRKAAQVLGVTTRGALPSNAQIEASLAERQRIFEPRSHEERLAEFRRIALLVMDQLADFQPRLVGAVLNGTATMNTAVELHAFSDLPEAVAAVLQAELGMALGNCERRYRYSARRTALVPGYRFVCRDVEILVFVFPENGLREAPLSPVDQRPMRRVSRQVLSKLVAGKDGDE